MRQPQQAGGRGRRRGRTGRRLALAAALLVAGGVVAAIAVDSAGIAPRQLAPYIEKRTSGHNAAIVAAGQFTAGTLQRLDRGTPAAPEDSQLSGLALGAQAGAAGDDKRAGTVVASAEALRAALARARAGDVITIAPGTYRLTGRLNADRPGAPGAPIVVRAALPGSVRLEFDMVAGFRVSAPHWHFENLEIHGVCQDDGACEHAFHVFGAASHFVARNNTISDFNAHFKINGLHGRFPDHGLIESNTLDASRPRRTANPVTPIDLVAASGWTIRANVISDFIKEGGNGISYGAFAKGGGSGNVFERNLVWCERRLRGLPGQRIGLSFGGGGTGKSVCRDGRCITEQDGGLLRANLVVGCSDVGIYLNSAANTRVEDNTLIDTTGIDVRFSTSSARLDGNLVDGPIRSRDDGLVREFDNRTSPVWQAFAGRHPVRSLFVAPGAGDFRWRGEAPLRERAREDDAGIADLCGGRRLQPPAYGAFDSIAGCGQRRDAAAVH
ncbi:right-handed parallel beta-helix repeat-containing protein [Massilia sp. UBA6681]|uniref:right-handed parallel beta-helix repeat-containing protein n=1 Tax=Massilia sp. UBA6681 TaxID=1946839 RepID=UPI0025B86C7A|nr:right-handed parallel beta-helix repeat-containing protein [Massilia sp. UBA6681]